LIPQHERHPNQEDVMINHKSELIAMKPTPANDSDQELMHATQVERTVDGTNIMVETVETTDQTLHVAMIVVGPNQQTKRRGSGESGAPRRRSA
jgi:hypothetical protein